MPIFHLKPVPALLDDPAWANSLFKGECWVNAANEIEARRLASGRYEDARANIPGQSRGPGPWMQPRLVAVMRYEHPPLGFDLPRGVVANRQV
jgi:hypothetical protein